MGPEELMSSERGTHHKTTPRMVASNWVCNLTIAELRGPCVLSAGQWVVAKGLRSLRLGQGGPEEIGC